MYIPTVLEQKLVMNSWKAVFVRWVEYTQFHTSVEALVRLSRLRLAIRCQARAFSAWNTRLKLRYTFSKRSLKTPYLEQNISADLERIRCQMYIQRKHLISFRIKRVLAAKDLKLKLSVCSNPTLKYLFSLHSKEIMRRINLENRLMFVAFHERHVHNYEVYIFNLSYTYVF